ncbi:endonuclease III [Halarchaeum acidiphilum MH1-52-1]|uniref:Endonuclease III n=1 Tax=Halarchaeum acidiphilum MH1-52-1 TaxID=1261545 RepID=U3ABJ4_9EURY|nr:GIY-YIG nuclease family protein [Halarchaeum acidiphilum]GAD52143.1 endonuclease III [Halarchaeum acidiphilum MH1-52-1]
MDPGTYTLLVSLPASTDVTFGAAGERRLDPGWYAYTGSAFGPGGLSRVERHRRVAAGEHDVRHWHVDSLTGHPETRLDAVYVTENRDHECAIARALNDAAEPIPGLGASDCDCETHVAYAPERETVAATVHGEHEAER